MEEIKVIIKLEKELKPGEKFAIEDAIFDALRGQGFEPTSVEVVF